MKTADALKQAARMNAWCRGQDDYPVQDRCNFDASAQQEEFAAYWAGWNDKAIERDKEAGEPAPFHKG